MPRDAVPAVTSESASTAGELRIAQRWLASLILAPEKLECDDVGREIDARLTTTAPGDRAALLVRLRAYTNGFSARLHEAIAADYPALAHVLGAREFHAVVARYRAHVPAGTYSLDDAGAALPDFLAADVASQAFPFAPDLARLEAAVRRAFHSFELPPFDASGLAAWTLEDWSAATLELQPSVAVVSSAWPIGDIWRAREKPIEDIDIDLVGRPDRVFVHRAGFKIVCDSIGDDEAAALESLLAGASLGATAEALADAGHDPAEVSRWFARWSARGLVVGCRRRARTGAE